MRLVVFGTVCLCPSAILIFVMILLICFVAKVGMAARLSIVRHCGFCFDFLYDSGNYSNTRAYGTLPSSTIVPFKVIIDSVSAREGSVFICFGHFSGMFAQVVFDVVHVY